MLSNFITFEVYRKEFGWAPYIKKGLILSDEDIAATIRLFIRKEIEENKSMF